MSVFNEDRDRQVIPRWRAFASSAAFGELAPLTRGQTYAFTPTMLGPVLEDWRREPGLSVAADVVSVAFSIGCTRAARDAAEFVLEHKEATPAAREIAQRCLVDTDMGPSPLFIQRYAQPTLSGLQQAIHQAKERLIGFPNNPVLWTNLALFFTTLGQHEQAKRAMRTALQLAPENRFVVRSACRLFVHQGDIEQAHSVLLRTASLSVDPWLLAGEVAVSAIGGKSSRFIKTARSMTESGKHSPFHLSELAGAMATLEARDGALKRAKRLCTLSLEDPSENAIAQAAWLSRKVVGMKWESSASQGVQSSEANAWLATLRGDWTCALSNAKRWQDEQPFSSRPALLGGYVASTALEDFSEAEAMLRMAIRGNRDDAMLHNDLAFVLAKQGKVAEAKRLAKQGFRLKANLVERVCLTATCGLIEYRSQRPQQGAKLYRQAIEMASGECHVHVRHIAIVNHAIENIRIGTAAALTVQSEALGAAEKLPEPLRSLFIEKLRKADWSQTRRQNGNEVSGGDTEA